MVDTPRDHQVERRHGPGVPRWPALLALLLIGIIYYLVSDRLTVGPRWLLLALTLLFVPPLFLISRLGYHRLTRWLALSLTVLVTLAVAISAGFLLATLPKGALPAATLLRDAALLWVTNILAFAVWYWEIDGGGPAYRHPGRHSSTDFAFPQMQQDDDDVVENWSPGFIDYLFLAFNTSTAFSPTDTLVLSRRAKLLMMSQSLISVLVVAVLAARAINTL